MSRTVGRVLAESLIAHGIDTIWMVPGESFLGLTDALTEVPEVRLIVCRHEGGAGFMAVADGRMREGRAGVLLVSRGPGLSNAMVALHTAYHDATPLVVLCGQVERKDFGRLALQEQNYSKLLADVTKDVIEVNEVVQASESIARAFHLAESGTPGPVAVILPEDIFDEPTEAPVAKPRPRVYGGAREEDLDKLADMLAKAERPLVWVGGALANAGAGTLDELRQLAEQWVLPVSPTHRRPQLFDAGHPNYGGYMGIRVPKQLVEEMKKADLLVSLGERLTDSVSQSYSFPTAPDPQLPLVHVWPDANEIGRVFRPDLGIAAEPAAIIRALLKRGAPAGAAKRAGWVAGLNTIHNTLMQPNWDSMSDGVNFAAICVEVGKHLAPDAAVTSDAGNFSSFIHRYIGFRPGQNFLSSVVGAMGAGVPMAVAAAIRRPGKQAVAFVGDGGALMSGNEIATAMQYGAAPIIILSDNKRYGTIGMHHEVRYPNRPYEDAVRLTNPDFAAWARVFGAEGITISTEAEVEEGIARAFAVKTKPVVVHVHTSAEQMSAWRRRGAPRVHG
ncbi:thiamine pyrophosphate TPP-binding domain-containing protein [Siccirubricoccus deserti]|uniref:Acetolactate synthase n=1 Tax=Siccirubricoccus deserti TaxID=2013562 RepID=A0A9X0R4F4_9PROT|nr:thiamine pyrophosphate-dependent enzyme [Siccirubricoccus deserti]MBC4018167.1 acetolactate synthase [Siccirubricoccus deserti]GGC63361.1 thiamine pyrophosphate TPP-binding domain-containing protein [Siccirubricoccus deserti]